MTSANVTQSKFNLTALSFFFLLSSAYLDTWRFPTPRTLQDTLIVENVFHQPSPTHGPHGEDCLLQLMLVHMELRVQLSGTAQGHSAKEHAAETTMVMNLPFGM